MTAQENQQGTQKQREEDFWLSEERYRVLVETLPHGIEECDTSGIITAANSAYHKIFGYDDGELVGTAIWDKLASEEQCHEERRRFFTLVEEQPPPFTVYTRNLTKDERIIDIQVDWNYKHDKQQRLIGFVAVITDITEQRQAEESLRVQNRELGLLNDMNTLLQACRKEGETYRVVHSVCKQFFPEDAGFLFMMDDSRTMLQEVTYWGTPPPEPRIFDVDDCWALRLGKVHFIENAESGLLCPHLNSLPEHGYLCAPINASGGVLGTLHLCFGDYISYLSQKQRAHITEHKQIMVERLAEQYSLSLVNLRLRETLRLESIRDPLTGLYNRRHMEASLAREVFRAKRRGTPVSIIMLDIDHFKPLNDAYGHEAGDVILRELAAMVQQYIRAEDIACRYGGEEFLLILPEAPLDIAAKRAEDIRKRGEKLHLVYQRIVVNITISLGVAIFPEHGADMKAVVKAADAALYQAKERGRNQVVVASPMTKEEEREM